MSPKIDLHTHTLASDGALTPGQLVERAAGQGVAYLAVTDHDTCAGLAEAETAAAAFGITLIPGIELSTIWKGVGIHVLGLMIDPEHPAMLEAVAFQSRARAERAVQIGEKLAKLKMPGVYERARQIAGRAEIGRPHFARALVEMGYVDSEQDAFARFLGARKAGDIKTHWPTLETVIRWVLDAGGVPVLAHPGKYDMTWTKLRAFLKDFVAAGGQGMEISYGGENPDRLLELSRMAQKYGLKASAGSDFHSPRMHWTEVGKYPPLRGEYQPVWQGWV